MRNLLKSLPQSDSQVTNEVRRQSRVLGIPAPLVVFWSRGDGLWVDEDDGSTIYLPSKEFIGVYDPDCSPDAFWELVYHELSHHATYILHNKTGHCTKMYEILTGLVLTNDLSLTILNTYERDYKPRAWKSGRYAAGRAIIEKNRKRRKN